MNINNENKRYPVVPMRDVIIFPQTIIPLLVGRDASKEAVERALNEDRKILCVSQKSFVESDEDPKAKDIYRVGTICNIIQDLKLPDGTIRLLVEGEKRVKVEKFVRTANCLLAEIYFSDKKLPKNTIELEALLRAFKKKFKLYINLNKSIPNSANIPIEEDVKVEEFLYSVLANMQAEIGKKQKIFELDSVEESIKILYRFVMEEIEILHLENKIDSTVKHKLNKMQRDYYLTEQLDAINK
ncbi:MAG: LON peptidase substrate-binding domain-containing protein, partial [Candidatus Cloacimonetes bacterium]|nr:LON peptidase substrate-binding domain-containing protein [Candidatus Cloacimonadota bacterium]